MAGCRPSSPTLRTRVEGVSRPLLVRLSSLPRPAVLIGTLALVVVGLLAPLPVALPALVVVFAFVAVDRVPLLAGGRPPAARWPASPCSPCIVVLAATRF